MNREEIKSELEKIGKATKPNETVVANIADFILANFTPKGEYSETEETCKECMGPCGNCEPKGEAEKVTAKEMYKLLIEKRLIEGVTWEEIAKTAHKAAEDFNNYKPE